MRRIIYTIALTLLAQSAYAQAPELAVWEQNMIRFGQMHCAMLQDGSGASPDEQLLGTYYDAARIYEQIARYTNDPFTWSRCRDAALRIYRDRYVTPAGGNIPGYWIFTRGLSLDFQRYGSSISRDAAISISHNAAFARDSTPLVGPDSTADFKQSREAAYVINAYLDAEELGDIRRSRLSVVFGDALGHLNQYSDPNNYVKPFFIALTAEALIRYDERIGDTRILPALEKIADIMWGRAWNEASGSMLYIDKNVTGEDPPDPAPNLNLLIAPMYEWLYQKTGSIRHRDHADKLFVGGLGRYDSGGFHTGGAYLNAAKVFNQNYHWSFDYVKSRNGNSVTPTATSTATSTNNPTRTATSTPTSTATPTRTASPSPTRTATPTALATPSRTPCGSNFVKADVYCHINRLEGK